jgi:hypothetical protein
VSKRRLIWYGSVLLCAMIAVAGYLAFSAAAGYGLGYPLDDAWIHMTYARNLVQFGEWMFIPGIVSGGSTSPLWTILLTPIFLLKMNPILWTSIGGVIGLGTLAVLADLFLYAFDEKQYGFWIIAVVVFEWHLIWAGLSGMETLLQTVGNLAVMLLLTVVKKNNHPEYWFLLGLVIGGLVWVRPDSVTWLGPAFVLLMYESINQKKVRNMGWIALSFGFLLPFAAYLAFNQKVAGSFWPNTMYAKQAEYQSQLMLPFTQRYLQQLGLPFVGIAVLFIPGLIYLAYHAIRNKNMLLIVIFLWWLGMAGLYALRLPVVYQHGRYMIPAMIVPLLFGLAGTRQLFQSVKLNWIWNRRLQFGGQALMIGLQLAFYGMGAGAYRDDVGIIQTEMVQTAQWVGRNLPQDARLAVHDIGAMGYYGNHNFIDLAGLINPEVIPFIRDEVQLAIYLDAQKVEYVIVFPNWYSSLLDKKKVYYSTNELLSPAKGGENMSIFCWKNCD